MELLPLLRITLFSSLLFSFEPLNSSSFFFNKQQSRAEDDVLKLAVASPRAFISQV